MFLINERLARTGRARGGEEFAAGNSDLLAGKPGVLEAYYRPGDLDSDLSRRVFVLPRPTLLA